MENRARNALNRLAPSPITSNSATQRRTTILFLSEFRDCCLNQIEYLRAELTQRIGPTAIDQEEMLYFNGPIIGITEMDQEPRMSISAVLEYIPKFRELIQKLKRK